MPNGSIWHLIKFHPMDWKIKKIIAVADAVFSRQRAPGVRPKTYYLAKFLAKTALKSKKCDWGGGPCVNSTPLDLPIYCIGIICL